MYNRRCFLLFSECPNPSPSTCLGVFGLSLYTTERDLREVFNHYGPLASVNVVYDQRTGRSRGFAFVYFEKIEDAKAAMEKANGMELDERRIRVDFSFTKRAHTPTPGIYMGRSTRNNGSWRGNNRRGRGSYHDGGYGRGYDRDYDYDHGYDRGYDHGYDRHDRYSKYDRNDRNDRYDRNDKYDRYDRYDDYDDRYR
uniref:Transformer 2 alpha homolog n=1 Tax=Gouania willdenowi TaxID=441366 RepID=A0A8C5D6U2_GOUWI